MKSLQHKPSIVHFAWLLSALTSLLAVIAWWGLYFDSLVESVVIYQLFPLFGLLAFSLMWSHYVMAAVRQYLGQEKAVLQSYFETTSMVVLVLILLHPGLFVWQLWRDGFGLPPESYKAYVGSALYGFVILGVVSLMAFLAFELRRFYENRTWWKYVQYASDMAILLILVHSLKLGNTLEATWLKGLWILYGITLVVSIVYIRFIKSQKEK